MLFLSNADLQVEQIFRASTFCPLIIVLITFPDADGFFKSFETKVDRKLNMHVQIH